MSQGGPGPQDLDRNRRDDQPATENQRYEKGNTRHNPNTNSTASTAGHVAAGNLPPSQAARNTQRLRWTADMNQFLYRCYMRITKLETDDVPYSVELHRCVISQFPELQNKTVQNILDQKRQLFVKDKIPTQVMEQIRNEVAQELGLATDDTNTQQPPQVAQDLVDQQYQPPTNSAAENMFGKNILQYGGMDPSKRPKLQKLHVKNPIEIKSIISEVNDMIQQNLGTCDNLADVHALIYIGAATVLETLGHKLTEEKTPGKEESSTREKPKPWERRIRTAIQKLRIEIGRMTQYLNKVNPSPKVIRKAENIIMKYRNAENVTPVDILDLLKQKLNVKANRLRRYKDSATRRNQNRLFNNNQKAFYRQIMKENNPEALETPLLDEEVTKNFWSNIWSRAENHKGKAKWITEEKRKTQKIPFMTDYKVTTEDVSKAIRKTMNWKAAGIDKVQNFWIKKFIATHAILAYHFNIIIEEKQQIPEFFTEGITYLLPKTKPPSEDPSKYRPITCLPTVYKLFTAIVTEKINKHLDLHNIIAEEQKGCRRGSQGCKEQLVIDAVLTQDAKKKKRTLHWAYIDYKKAFDSVPHSWLTEILEIYKINPMISAILTTLMKKWTTNLVLGFKHVGKISIKRGIFQGDSLSALWFCLALNPLSTILNEKKYGYALAPTSCKISHLAYMDDIKVLAENEQEIKHLIKQIETFSRDIKMEFGVEKCRISSMAKGKWRPQEDYNMCKNIIKGMEKDETYKYLGIQQSVGTDHAQMKLHLTALYKQRLQKLLKSKLDGNNLVKAVNAFAIPVLGYSFGILKWTKTDLENLNRLTRVTFTKYRCHHPKSCVERFNLPRSQGGRGLSDIVAVHHRQIQVLRHFFLQKAESSLFHQSIVQADAQLTVLNLNNVDAYNEDQPFENEKKIENWMRKKLHGRYIATIRKDHMDFNATNDWLKYGKLFPETEGFACAIQDQVIATLNYRKVIINDTSITDDRCRMCRAVTENIDHIISGCQTLAPREYTARHDSVAKIIHTHLACKMGYTENIMPYYKYTPTAVCETNKGKLYWNRAINTDHYTPCNRPDIVYKDKRTNTAYLVDVAIPAPANVVKKYGEKISKYSPLAAELKNLWRLNSVRIVPVIIGATGEIPTSIHDALRLLDFPEKAYIGMQKATVLATCNIVRKVLNINAL